MNQKGFVGHSITSFSGLSIFIGLLVDYKEAATKVSNMFPYIEPFIPLISIGGAVGFGLYVVLFLPGIIISFIHSRLPTVKWGKEYEAKCAELASHIDKYVNRNKDGVPQFYSKARQMAIELSKHGIACPPVRRNNQYCEQFWITFMIVIAAYASQNDLRGARKAMKTLELDDDELWEKIEEFTASPLMPQTPDKSDS